MQEEQPLSEAKEYMELLDGLKENVKNAQIRAALSVNRELVLLYWRIGKNLLESQQNSKWGADIIGHLAKDLHHTFPEMKGFSRRNLQYMRRFAEIWKDEQFVQATPAQITWYHNCTLLDKVKDLPALEWYIRQTVESGWSRDVLVHQIESKLYERQGKAITNFARTLPPPQSDLAQQIIKDPYNFDFLSLGLEVQERDLENALLQHIRQFLLELGTGFAFVGSQYHLEVRNKDYYLDLLFYHLKLRCFVVIDLKIGEFLPEHAGKMNFYLTAVDEQLKQETDQPSIGLILCKTSDRVTAEYALRNINTPIGVSEYRLTEALPDEIKGSLPTIEEIEAELNSGIIEEDNAAEPKL
jgi:predicted nuclease of restriction endonuclease-like (RecB) superfamily